MVLLDEEAARRYAGHIEIATDRHLQLFEDLDALVAIRNYAFHEGRTQHANELSSDLPELTERLFMEVFAALKVGLGVGRRARGQHSLRTYEVWLDESARRAAVAGLRQGCAGDVLAVLATPRRHRGAPRAVRWDPVRPLTGPGDWLSRVWHDPRVSLPRSLAARRRRRRRPIDPAWIADPRCGGGLLVAVEPVEHSDRSVGHTISIF